jgi:formyl-CoA transferase
MGVGNDGAFRKLCEFLGMPEVARDERFATNGARVVNREALTALLDARFADEDGFELCPRMLAAGLPAGPVTHVDRALAAPHTEHREMVTELGWYRGLGTPIKMSRTPGGTRREPPRFGQDTAAVLAQHGFSEDEIAKLRDGGVVVEKRRT